eukprot:Polyplicarium_translucidae@DN3198_c0_g1_i7.p1
MKTDHLLNTAVAATLTALYSAGNEVLWGSSLRDVYKVDRSTESLVLIDNVAKPVELLATDTFRGIYSLLSDEGIFYVAAGNGIAAYGDEIHGDPKSKIVGHGVFLFEQAQPGEVVLSVSMTYDGHLAFLTNLGTVGIVTRDLAQLVDLEVMSRGELNLVSNSMAIDEHGGIYVVTSRLLCRLWWDSAAEAIRRSPSPSGDDITFADHCEDESSIGCTTWCSPYDTEDDAFEERPTKFGSGTTPSLLSHPDNGKLYVIIADGSRQQNVAIFSASDGVLSAKAPVSFGQEAESYTEQSLLVHENRIVVVQNAFTDAAKRMNNLLRAWNATDIATSAGLPHWAVDNVYLLPVALGDSPRGYQQFQFNPEHSDPSNRLVTTWNNVESGCPNAIPTMSAETRMLYCISKFDYMKGRRYPSGFEGGWALEALSWDTGEQLFIVRSGNDLRYNSMYAATQIGPDQEIIYGSIGGLSRMRLATPSEIQAATDGGFLDALVYGGQDTLDMSIDDPQYFFSGFIRDFVKKAMSNFLVSGPSTELLPSFDLSTIWNSLPLTTYLGSESAFQAALSGGGDGALEQLMQLFSSIGNSTNVDGLPSFADLFGDFKLDMNFGEMLFDMFKMAMDQTDDGFPTASPGEPLTAKDHFLQLMSDLGDVISNDDTSDPMQKFVQAARVFVDFVIEMIETAAVQKTADHLGAEPDRQKSSRGGRRGDRKSSKRNGTRGGRHGTAAAAEELPALPVETSTQAVLASRGIRAD